MPLLVIGIAAEDRILALDRLPVPGESVLARAVWHDVGGKGANQAVAAARSGAQVRLVAALGADAAGATIRTRLEQEGVDSRFCTPAQATPLSLVFVLPDGENAIIGVAQTEGLAAELLAPAFAGFGPGDWLLVSGLVDRTGLAFALARAKALGMSTAVNLAPIGFAYDGLWPEIDLVFANAAELTLHTGARTLPAAIRCLRAAGVREVLVTLGAEGALFADSRSWIRVPAPKVEVVDTTGAGDLLAGTFLGLRERGCEREVALKIAVAAASAKVSRRGTLSAFPTAAAIDALCAQLG
jgi:ribokinase